MTPNLLPQKYYYEYIRINFDIALSELNRFSEVGWRVCQIISNSRGESYYLLERCFEIKK